MNYQSLSGQLINFAKLSFPQPLAQCTVCKLKNVTSTLYFDDEAPAVFAINLTWNLHHKDSRKQVLNDQFKFLSTIPATFNFN